MPEGFASTSTPPATDAALQQLHADLLAILAKTGGSAPTASATNTAQESGGHLASLDGKVPALGQASSSGSVPVVLASDGPFTTNFGAKADAPATTDGGSFSLIALTKRLLAKVPGLGQALAAASLPVVLATDQSAVPAALASNAPNVVKAGVLTAAGQANGVVVPVGQLAALGLQLGGTWTGSVVVLASQDGGVTYPITLTPRAPAAGPASAFTYNANLWVNPGAVTHVLVYAVTLSSGTVQVSTAATNAARDVRVYNAPADPLTVVNPTGTMIQTIVTGASGLLVAANPNRKSLRWMNVGAADTTVAPGTAPPAAGQGMVYGAALSSSGTPVAGKQGGSEAFTEGAVCTSAFSFSASTSATIAVWECY